MHPRDGRSAGFNSPGMCFQFLLQDIFRISLTRLSTKGAQGQLRCIQNTTVLESLQYVTFLSVILRESNVEHANLTPIQAAKSSSRGIVIDVTGATLAFAVINDTLTWEAPSTRAKITAAYAFLLASQNTWNVTLASWTGDLNAQRGKRSWLSVVKPLSHFLNSFWISSQTSSSHLILEIQVYCNKSLGMIIIGQTKPKGSKMRCE